MECLLYARINLVIDPKLPNEQVDFRHGKSPVDQITLLNNDIEDTFQAGEKAGVVFLDLTAAYDTVWLLQMLPHRHLGDFILEMLTNHSFTLHTSDGQHRQLQRLRNGIPQSSVLAHVLFNIYVQGSRLHSPRSTDTQTISPSFSLTSAGRQLKSLHRHGQTCPLPQEVAPEAQCHEDHVLLVSSQQPRGKVQAQSMVDGNGLQFKATLMYIGVKLDWILTFQQHLEKMSAKNNIPRLSDLPPRRNHLGSRNEDNPHHHSGSVLLRCRVLSTGLVQKPPHKETGRGTDQLLAYNLRISARHSSQSPSDPL